MSSEFIFVTAWPHHQTGGTFDRAAVARMGRELAARAEDSAVAGVILTISGEGFKLAITKSLGTDDGPHQS